MPLIIICGYPCVGKSHFTERLVEYLRKEHSYCETAVVTGSFSYASSSSIEKEERGQLRSAVSQKLNGVDFLIVDAMNYIKGFRYELYCIARSVRTAHCVVWVDCEEKLPVSWNNARLLESASGYDTKV